MKIAIIGKTEDKIKSLAEKVKEFGFIYSNENPDIVLSYGGDGMFLISERVFPRVPKIIIKDSDICNLACKYDIEVILKKLKEESYNLIEVPKLKAIRKGQFEIRELVGINDIVIRNTLPTEAIRFRYRINNQEFSPILIGDGVVISTAFGSKKGAYFYSITKREFEKDFGIAFNNITEEHKEILLKKDDILEIEITRGNGVLVADNNRDYINLERNDLIRVHLIDDFAKIIRFE